MIGREYDFLVWHSPPSSAKLVNTTTSKWAWWGWVTDYLPVTPGSTLRIRVWARQENVQYTHSHVAVDGYDGSKWRRIYALRLPLGSFDWTLFDEETTIPGDIVAIRISLAGGAGGTTWYDDLEVYVDNQLVLKEDFNRYHPIIGALAGAALGAASKNTLATITGMIIGGIAGYILGKKR